MTNTDNTERQMHPAVRDLLSQIGRNIYLSGLNMEKEIDCTRTSDVPNETYRVEFTVNC